MGYVECPATAFRRQLVLQVKPKQYVYSSLRLSDSQSFGNDGCALWALYVKLLSVIFAISPPVDLISRPALRLSVDLPCEGLACVRFSSNGSVTQWWRPSEIASSGYYLTVPSVPTVDVRIDFFLGERARNGLTCAFAMQPRAQGSYPTRAWQPPGAQ